MLKLAVTTGFTGYNSKIIPQEHKIGIKTILCVNPGSDFSVSFRMRDNGLMDIHLGDSYLHSMQLVHEAQNIRFLTVSGDIQKVIGLDFKFGNN